MDNIFKSYSLDNIKWYKSKYDLDYLCMYSRHIKKDLLHRCDFITAVSYDRELFDNYLDTWLDFTNSNQKNLDISACSLVGCSDIENILLSQSILPSWVKIYNFSVHLFSSSWIDFTFTPLQFVVFPNNTDNSIKAKINIYWLSFRAQSICEFSIIWFLFYLLMCSGLFIIPDDNINNDIFKDISLDNIDSILWGSGAVSSFFSKNKNLFDLYQKDLLNNSILLQKLNQFYITRFDYCFDFFMDKSIKSIDFHRLFRGKDLKYQPYLWGSVNIPVWYEDYIFYDKKWHMDTGWLYQNNNKKWVSVRCYDKQIKLIMDWQCDFYSDYMDKKYKVWRLEYEFHSDFCCPSDKKNHYDGKVFLLDELYNYTLSVRALSYFWLSQQKDIFYKKYPVVVDWDNRTYLWQYQFIKRFGNMLLQIKNQKIPVSFIWQKLWLFDNNLILDALITDLKSSETYSKLSKTKSVGSEYELKQVWDSLKRKLLNHWISSPYWFDELWDLLKYFQ